MGEIAFAAATAQFAAWALLFTKRTQAKLNWWVWLTLLSALGLMGVVTYKALWHTTGLALSFLAIASLILFAINLAVAIGRPKHRTWALALITLPPAIIVSVALIFIEPLVTTPAASIGEALHILMAITGYSLLLVAAVQAAGLGYQDHALRTHNLKSLARSLPPIQSMESAMFKTLLLGTLVLGAAIVLGFTVYDDLLQRHVAHKTLFAIAAWATFASILLGHHLKGWSGVRVIKLITVATVLLLLAYFGSETIAMIIGR